MSGEALTVLAVHQDHAVLDRIVEAAHDVNPMVAVRHAVCLDEAGQAGALHLADVVLIQAELAACTPGWLRPREAATVTPVIGLIASDRDVALLEALDADLHVPAGSDPDAMREALGAALELGWCRATVSRAARPLDAELRSRKRSVWTGSAKEQLEDAGLVGASMALRAPAPPAWP